MSAIVQAYNRSPSGNCKASDDWKKKKKKKKEKKTEHETDIDLCLL